jgi:hypothetical protein
VRRELKGKGGVESEVGFIFITKNRHGLRLNEQMNSSKKKTKQ